MKFLRVNTTEKGINTEDVPQNYLGRGDRTVNKRAGREIDT